MIHHAQLIRSESPLDFVYAESDVEIVYSDLERVGIDEVRELQRNAYQKPQYAPVQVIVIRSQQVTVEAQNALLKLFEEPPETTRFVLVLPDGFQILQTLESRLIEQRSEESFDRSVWEAFQAASIKERLQQIDSWQKKKDAAWLMGIQTGLQQWVQTTKYPTKTIQLVAERLGTRGASSKMLLEALALEQQLQKK